MKVTTDACLFGAYVADSIKNSKSKIQNTLDIGTGTGLLSLMLAQKSNSMIDAVEIDEHAYLQAKENFEQSPWKERLTAFNTDVQHFNSAGKYDCIITNPPFFEDDLASPDQNKNKAKHNASLTLKQLLLAVHSNLKYNGDFFILLPYHRSDYFEKEASLAGYFLKEKLIVKQTPKHNYFRSILNFVSTECGTSVNELTIKNADGNYTDEFTALLKDYYLFA